MVRIQYYRPKPYHLCHHGIKGMHWGIRRFGKKKNTTNKRKERYSKGNSIGKKLTIGFALTAAATVAIPVGIVVVKALLSTSGDKTLKSVGRSLIKNGKAKVRESISML